MTIEKIFEDYINNPEHYNPKVVKYINEHKKEFEEYKKNKKASYSNGVKKIAKYLKEASKLNVGYRT